MNKKVRVRFAPSPTGFLHLGNIRAALLNFLFARQRNGTFVLRIEDTDQARNVDEAGLKIIEDLKWLNLSFDEGPFLQSDRINLYQETLDDLVAQQKVYRCFCSKEVLEQKRKAQLERGQPPRYDRTCLHLSDDEIEKKRAAQEPFIWRFKVNQEQEIVVKSMARKNLTFEMKNFSDFALTRADGSFTFLFANFVDDWLMEITHVIRGEDHLSNTAMQAALFDALAVECPTFWHLPILCNAEGKKLSKRDFGFSLDDLRAEGFLAEAVCNYLAIIGGTFQNEVQSLDELIHAFDFDHMHATGAIKYDVEKLRWLNHKWIERLDATALAPQIVPFLNQEIHASKSVSEERLLYLIDKVKGDCKTLKDFVGALRFCFEKPEVTLEKIEAYVGKEKATIIAPLIDSVREYAGQRDLFLETLKREGKAAGLKPKEFFGVVRYLLSGQFQGLGMHDLLDMLDDTEIKERLALG